MRLLFGDFVLDAGTRQLRRGGEDRRLGPKGFEMLALLLRHRPNVVAKETIRDQLWPGTYVSGTTLATVVNKVRIALEDDRKSPRFLRTVHGLGYAFCGEAREEATPPSVSSAVRLSCRLLYEDREISLHPGENLLGRVDECVLWIESPSVSRRHARIVVEGSGAILEDLHSKNGTFLRGQRIATAVALADHDEIALGSVRLTFRILPIDVTTRTDEGA
jgi:DNA-binding winged helix-turn-helix (wHTH) protein